MKRRYKLLAWLIGVPLLLVAVAAVLLPHIVDSDRIKQAVVAQAQEQTGHTLVLGGEVRLHLFPAIRVTVTDVRIANPPGFGKDDLVRVPWLMVEIAPLPLLSGSVEPTSVTLSGMVVDLERDEDGRANWVSDATPADTPTGAAPLGAFALGGLHVKDAKLTWRDEEAGESFSVTDIDLQTGSVSDEAGIEDIRVSAALPDLGVAFTARGDAKLTEDGFTVPELRVEPRGITVADMSVEGEVRSKFTAALADNRIHLDNLFAELRGAGDDGRRFSSAVATALAIDVDAGRFETSELSISVTLSGFDGLKGVADISGSLSGDLDAGVYRVAGLEGSGKAGVEEGWVTTFTVSGSLAADPDADRYVLSPLNVAGDLGDGASPFQLSGDLALTRAGRLVTATNTRLAVAGLVVDGDLTVHANPDRGGAEAALDLRVEDHPVSGIVSVTSADHNGYDLDASLLADLTAKPGPFGLEGKSAIVLSARARRAGDPGTWNLKDTKLGARLADKAFPNGELVLRASADLAIDPEAESVRADPFRLALEESALEGTVSVKGFEAPAVRFDLEADTFDADRYGVPVAAGGNKEPTPIAQTLETLRALDVEGELRVRRLRFQGTLLEDVKVTAHGAESGG